MCDHSTYVVMSPTRSWVAKWQRVGAYLFSFFTQLLHYVSVARDKGSGMGDTRTHVLLFFFPNLTFMDIFALFCVCLEVQLLLYQERTPSPSTQGCQKILSSN